MNSKTKILFIAIMLVAAVFLSGCTDSNSADETSSGSEKITEKVSPVNETVNNTNDKKMSIREDIETNETNETIVDSSLNTTNTTNITTPTPIRYSSSGGSSSKSSGSSSQSSDSDETTIEKLVIGTTDQVTDINVNDDSFVTYRETLLTKSLIRVGADGSYVPALAESWETTDGKVWTFHMVKDATWHDGTPVTSADIKFSLEYLPEKLGGSNWNIIDTVETPDSYTVVITLKSASANFLNNLLMLRTVPMHIFESVDDPKTFNNETAAIGCGPYVFEKFDKEAGLITFKAYDNYYEGKPAIDTIEIRMFKNQETMAMALDKGEIDTMYIYSGGLNYYYVPSLLQNNDIELMTISNLGVPNVLWINNNQTPANNVTYREALSYTIDYSEICNLMTSGYGSIPNAGFIPKGSYNYVETRELSLNVSKANQLLNESGIIDRDDDGFRDLSDGTKYQPELLVKSDVDSVRLAGLMKQYFNNVGLDLQVKAVDGGTFWDSVDAKDYDMFITRTTPWGMSMESGYATGYMDSRSNGWPVMYDPVFTTLVDQLLVTTDTQQTQDLAAQVQNYYATNYPVIALYWDDYIQPYNNKYEGYSQDPIYGILSYGTLYNLHEA